MFIGKRGDVAGPAPVNPRSQPPRRDAVVPEPSASGPATSPSTVVDAGAAADAGPAAVPGDALLPLAPYRLPPEDATPRRARPARALNVMHATTRVEVVAPHVLPCAKPKSVRGHGPHPAIALTETERVRLQVMQVQLRLTSLNLYEGPIDGQLSHDTVTGVRLFQTLKGMRESGTLTVGTLNALGVSPIV